MQLNEITELARNYGKSHSELVAEVTALNNAIIALKRQHLGRINRLKNVAASKKANLHAAIDSSPELFKKPRTFTVDGIKFGYAKQKGSLVFDDAETLVARIKDIYKGKAKDLINTKETPDKTALRNLTEAELRKLGCDITADGDRVVVESTADEVEKLVDALLKDATEQNITLTEAA